MEFGGLLYGLKGPYLFLFLLGVGRAFSPACVVPCGQIVP